MENDKVEKVINMIKEMEIKDKLRLGICLSRSSWANLMYDKAKMYEEFDKKLKEIDEEYIATWWQKSRTCHDHTDIPD